MVVVYCKSKDCDHHVVIQADKNGHHNMGSAPKFCGKCGDSMIHQCPNCSAYRKKTEYKFCDDCGKQYK